jgi:hypothetical protein
MLGNIRLYEYLPSLTSLFIIALSEVANPWLKSLINEAVSGKQGLEDKSDLIKNIALDWSYRLAFITSSFAAIISLFIVFSKSKDYDLLALTAVLLLAAFILMLVWILRFGAGQLVDTKVLISSHRVAPRVICITFLILVNVSLMFMIYFSSMSPAIQASEK